MPELVPPQLIAPPGPVSSRAAVPWRAGPDERTAYVAGWLDAAAAAAPGAPIAALWAGAAPELRLCRALRTGSTRAYLIDADRGRLQRAMAAAPVGRVDGRHATLGALCAGHVRVHGCAAIYAPTLAAHLPPGLLSDLCGVLLDWLLPDGRLLLLLPGDMPREAADRHRRRLAGDGHRVVEDDDVHVVLAPRGGGARGTHRGLPT